MAGSVARRRRHSAKVKARVLEACEQPNASVARVALENGLNANLVNKWRQRAAAVMSLVQSAKLNGHNPYEYLKDILERLPTHPAGRIEELLPHRWRSPVVTS